MELNCIEYIITNKYESFKRNIFIKKRHLHYVYILLREPTCYKKIHCTTPVRSKVKAKKGKNFEKNFLA